MKVLKEVIWFRKIRKDNGFSFKISCKKSSQKIRFYSFSTSSGFPLATKESYLLWIAVSARMIQSEVNRGSKTWNLDNNNNCQISCIKKGFFESSWYFFWHKLKVYLLKSHVKFSVFQLKEKGRSPNQRVSYFCKRGNFVSNYVISSHTHSVSVLYNFSSATLCGTYTYFH